MRNISQRKNDGSQELRRRTRKLLCKRSQPHMKLLLHRIGRIKMNKFKSYLSGRNRMISKLGLRPRIFLGTCLLVFASPLFTAAAPVTFSASGADAASIQASVDAFRNAVGNPNNANNPGPLPGGRREINWDGGGVTTTISPTPFDGFQANRGAVFTTPGT